jgi:hypothetical protein
MASVGDRIRLSSNKGPAREGVVVAVTGTMLRVRWPSAEETTLVPGPGTVTVLGRSRTRATATTTKKKKAVTTKAGVKKKAAAVKKRVATGTKKKKR